MQENEKDKDMQQRPFDKDDKRTAIDIQKGKQNIVVQLKIRTWVVVNLSRLKSFRQES